MSFGAHGEFPHGALPDSAPAVTCALSGTVTASIDESDIVTGGKTIVLTLTNDTWVTAGATFDAQRQNIIDGIDSAQAEGTGWDAVVKAGLAVTAVVRTSDTVVTITLSAFGSYDITAQETITATVPASALTTSSSPVVASPTFTVDFVVANTVTLTDLTDNAVFQRNGSNAAVAVSGTYTGTPTAIEARVVEDGTSTEVVTWSTLDASPTGGTFSGTITTPSGGQYNVQVRFANDTGVTSNGTNGWSVGMTVGIIGDSIARNHFDIGTDITASAGTWFKDLADGAWKACTGFGNGGLQLANDLASHFSVPIGLYDYGVGAKKAAEWATTTPGGIYDDFIQAVEGGEIEAIVMVVGINDAATPETEADHETDLNTIITNLRSDLTNRSSASNLPIFHCIPGGSGAHADANVEAVRAGARDVIAGGTDVYLGAHLPDLVTTDGTHPTAASMTKVGQREALAIIDVLGSGTYGRGPAYASSIEVDSTHTDINITHRGGSDFTPTSAITGFEISDDDFSTTLTISAAVRQDADTIRLTHATASGTRKIRYLYGAAPTITSPVVDNTTETLPLEWFEAATVGVPATVSLAGISSAGSAGAMTAIGAATISISGVSSTGAAGTLTVDIAGVVNVSLSGISATGRIGNLSATGAASVSIGGASAIGSVGAVLASIGATDALITGASAAGSVGTMVITGAATVSISGVSSIGQVGSIGVAIPGSEVFITGTITITPAIGGTLELQPAIDGEIAIN